MVSEKVKVVSVDNFYERMVFKGEQKSVLLVEWEV